MEDRFKFRVWFNGLKRYSRNTDNLVLNDGGELGEFDTVGCYSEKDVVIEQCTGLKDKNGNLIYEGDIVREISKKEPEWEEYITEVKWGECGFNLYSDEDYGFEVIGNIHQNPETLKEEE